MVTIQLMNYTNSERCTMHAYSMNGLNKTSTQSINQEGEESERESERVSQRESSSVSESEKESEKKDLHQGELIDLKNPELYIYQEEESIKEVRVRKEEEWKMRIIEVATKEKNEKVRSML